MQSYYRSKLLRHLRRVQRAGIRHELVEDFAGLAETLHRQWLIVHQGADEFEREVLTSAFYHEFATRLGNCSKALLFYRGEELVGHALLLHDGELLRWLYFGRNTAANDSLYIYVGHAVIETAIRLGARRLEMGLTTYPIKQDLGAQIAPISFALRSPSRLIDPFVAPVYRLLNRTPALRDKNVFKTTGSAA
jgi:predicted N-acyltransferase